MCLNRRNREYVDNFLRSILKSCGIIRNEPVELELKLLALSKKYRKDSQRAQEPSKERKYEGPGQGKVMSETSGSDDRCALLIKGSLVTYPLYTISTSFSYDPFHYKFLWKS